MCLSPHEMSSAEIEEALASLREWVNSPDISDRYKQIWSGRIEYFEALLKERAENGTY